MLKMYETAAASQCIYIYIEHRLQTVHRCRNSYWQLGFGRLHKCSQSSASVNNHPVGIFVQLGPTRLDTGWYGHRSKTLRRVFLRCGWETAKTAGCRECKHWQNTKASELEQWNWYNVYTVKLYRTSDIKVPCSINSRAPFQKQAIWSPATCSASIP